MTSGIDLCIATHVSDISNSHIIIIISIIITYRYCHTAVSLKHFNSTNRWQ